ncbi:hypothetical protein ZEAMMB73_Zm00001d016679 [Zea mays]|jgi:hypothetical protein|uniref:Uncharacterized protein n=2 Tax=Zea mays TaxID=4577 RepID=A0A1D6H9P8_MAIZE|nr:hypothetical protein ZEAMMB73_Zm00001d016679 [Zea mays]AQK71430.1 hypothetical protein ZEAMMB73_Zm00001d016679 [Zea mays]
MKVESPRTSPSRADPSPRLHPSDIHLHLIATSMACRAWPRLRPAHLRGWPPRIPFFPPYEDHADADAGRRKESTRPRDAVMPVPLRDAATPRCPCPSPRRRDARTARACPHPDAPPPHHAPSSPCDPCPQPSFPYYLKAGIPNSPFLLLPLLDWRWSAPTTCALPASLSHLTLPGGDTPEDGGAAASRSTDVVGSKKQSLRAPRRSPSAWTTARRDATTTLMTASIAYLHFFLVLRIFSLGLFFPLSFMAYQVLNF